MRAILVGVRKQRPAIWQAIMLTSSLEVSATMRSAPLLPAARRVAGCASVARDGADVEAVLQFAQDVVAGVDDGDVVRLLARELLRGSAPDLARPQNDDLQVTSRIASRILAHGDFSGGARA
jgi:hypothetical protein